MRLLEPNGCGKMMSGIILPSRGVLKVLGEKPSDRKNSFKKQISLVMGKQKIFCLIFKKCLKLKHKDINFLKSVSQ